jgi:hypothetical protein
VTAPTATSTATPLLDGLIAFLHDDGWPVTRPPEPEPAVHTRCAGSVAEWGCTGRTFEQQGQVVFDSAVPVEVSEDVVPGFALLLAGANWKLHAGAFALDPSTGQVRLRTSLLSTQGPLLHAPAAKALVYANVLIVERCLPTLRAVANGSLGPVEGVQHLQL